MAGSGFRIAARSSSAICRLTCQRGKGRARGLSGGVGCVGRAQWKLGDGSASGSGDATWWTGCSPHGVLANHQKIGATDDLRASSNRCAPSRAAAAATSGAGSFKPVRCAGSSACRDHMTANLGRDLEQVQGRSQNHGSRGNDREQGYQCRIGRWPARLVVLAGALGALQTLRVCQAEEGELTAEQRGDDKSHDSLRLGDRLSPSLLNDLRAILDDDGLVTDDEECKAHAKPWNTYHHSPAWPGAVVYPRSTEEVVGIVKACSRYKVPLVPYGGGTSLEGHTTTPKGGVSIDMNRMKGIKTLNVEDMDVTIEPGIGWIELNSFLRQYGLFFPLDPGPGATIGGMCATRCSGSLAVRYGTMRDNVISIKAVLANGDVVKTAARARKSSAGYDLTRLMIGSEGTLGVITEITLKLQRIPEASTVAMCTFPSIKDAAAVASATMHAGIQVSRVELLDDVMIKGLNLGYGRSLPERPTLMFELIGTEASVKEQTERVEGIVSLHGGSHFVFAESDAEKEALWRMRKEALWSAATLKPGSEPMVTDVCVPLSRLAECINETKKDLDASRLPCPIIAHAGDGNFHVLILLDPNDPRDLEEANRLSSRITRRAIAMDGTCTGEHGIGVGKMKYLEEELGFEAVKTMATLKRALDPDNIMNPGKVLPKQYCC